MLHKCGRAALVRIDRLTADEAERRQQDAADRRRRMQELRASSHYLADQTSGPDAGAAAPTGRAAQEMMDRLTRILSTAARQFEGCHNKGL